MSARLNASAHATAAVSACCPLQPVTSTCASSASARAASSPRCWIPRRRVDCALWAVVMAAYIGGISTRKDDALVPALGDQSGLQDLGEPHLPGHRRAGAGLPEPAPAGDRLRLCLPGYHLLPQGTAGPEGVRRRERGLLEGLVLIRSKSCAFSKRSL